MEKAVSAADANRKFSLILRDVRGSVQVVIDTAEELAELEGLLPETVLSCMVAVLMFGSKPFGQVITMAKAVPLVPVGPKTRFAAEKST